MFYGTKISMGKMSFLIKKTKSGISRGMKKTRQNFYLLKSKNYFENILDKDFIIKNTTDHSRNILKILDPQTLILVVDGTLMKSFQPC